MNWKVISINVILVLVIILFSNPLVAQVDSLKIIVIPWNLELKKTFNKVDDFIVPNSFQTFILKNYFEKNYEIPKIIKSQKFSNNQNSILDIRLVFIIYSNSKSDTIALSRGGSLLINNRKHILNNKLVDFLTKLLPCTYITNMKDNIVFEEETNEEYFK